MEPAATLELDAQYRQLREECGLLERSRGILAVRGAEAAEYLQGQLTNDIEGLEPGEGCYAALLDRKGHIQADMRVLRRAPDELLIDTEPAALAAAMRHLTMYSVGRELEIADLSGELSILGLIGPRAAEIALACGVDAVPSRLGLDVIVPAAELEATRAALAGAGAREVSEEAAEIVRVESGIPRLGAEMGSETMPAEAGIVDAAIDFEKGCYIGQETVARLHYRGRPNRHLRGLRLDGPALPGEPLLLGEKEVGALATVCLSPAFGRIALAIVRREAEPGRVLAVGGGATSAEVVELPFAEPA